ncbi:hypothetical protein DNTS_004984 [Danionella cerebrum]|uniref:Uncharacterized protein n=1 Tax=Danionella cerebrum TaxID=2873325 RepID=A0A553RLB8_9TELE|nr:hypothetical protein DNTS_004984 [Danionella translucida]
MMVLRSEGFFLNQCLCLGPIGCLDESAMRSRDAQLETPSLPRGFQTFQFIVNGRGTVVDPKPSVPEPSCNSLNRPIQRIQPSQCPRPLLLYLLCFLPQVSLAEAATSSALELVQGLMGDVGENMNLNSFITFALLRLSPNLQFIHRENRESLPSFYLHLRQMELHSISQVPRGEMELSRNPAAPRCVFIVCVKHHHLVEGDGREECVFSSAA